MRRGLGLSWLQSTNSHVSDSLSSSRIRNFEADFRSHASAENQVFQNFITDSYLQPSMELAREWLEFPAGTYFAISSLRSARTSPSGRVSGPGVASSRDRRFIMIFTQSPHSTTEKRVTRIPQVSHRPAQYTE